MNACRVRLFVVTVLLLILPLSAQAATPRTLVATVVSVSAGDTITALASEGTKLRIRLLGIDAPEIPHDRKRGQPFGEEARDHLDRLIGGKTVKVETYGPDRYKRILGVIWDGPVNVNLEMVRVGLAEVYRGHACQAYCDDLFRAEVQARNRRLKMWSQGSSYESPAAFRHRMRIRGD